MKRLILFLLISTLSFAQGSATHGQNSPQPAGNSCGGAGSIPAGAALVFETRSGQLGDSCSAHNPCQNGDAMDQWKDQSGNARNLTPDAGSATYTSSQFGTVAGAVFNGSTSSYIHASLDFNVSTLCAVIKNDAANAVGTLFSQSGSAALDYRSYAAGGQLHELVKSGVALIGQSTTAYGSGTAHLVCATYDGTGGAGAGVWAFYTDGSAAGSGTNGPVITNNNQQIGENGGAEFYKGSIGMLLAWQSVLTSTNLTQDIPRYACTNYGTTAP